MQVGDQTFFVYEGEPLVPGNNYYARVRAKDDFSWGGWAETEFTFIDRPYINELRINQVDGDLHFVELIGPGEYALEELYLITIGGDASETDGLLGTVLSLPGQMPTDGMLLIGNGDAWGTTPDVEADFYLPEGENVTFMLVSGLTVSEGYDLDGDDDGSIDDDPPWTEILDSVAMGDDGDNPAYSPVEMGVDPDEPLGVAHHAFRCPDAGINWTLGISSREQMSFSEAEEPHSNRRRR